MGTVLTRSFPLSILLFVSFLVFGPGCNRTSECGDQELQLARVLQAKRGEDRYVLTVIRSAAGRTLVRTDTSTCRTWRMQLQEGEWEAIAPETRAPGEGLPIEPGRYLVSRVRSKDGPMLLCNDVMNGYVYRMSMSGEGGWTQIEEPDDYLGKLDRIPLIRQATGGSESPGEVEEPTEADAEANAVSMRETIRDKEFPPEMRAFAASALGDIRSEETLPALVEALTDPDPAVVVAAIRALELNGDPEAIPELGELLSHEDEEVRSASQRVIEVLSE